MNADRPMPPHRVPTLTEVVVWPEPVTADIAPESLVESTAVPIDVRPVEWAEPAPPAAFDQVPDTAEPTPAATPEPQPLAVLPTEEQLTQRVLADIQRQVELMLDYRLREALAPLLARATDGLVRDARQELASTLRDVVARAVAQELSRHRTR